MNVYEKIRNANAETTQVQLKVTAQNEEIVELQKYKIAYRKMVGAGFQLDESGSAAEPNESVLQASPFERVIDTRDRSYKHLHAPRIPGGKKYNRQIPRLRYEYGNDGRLGPSKYGSNCHWDLGLCFAHFYTGVLCEHGNACEWRHNALTIAERGYILALPGGKEFIDTADKCSMRKSYLHG